MGGAGGRGNRFGFNAGCHAAISNSWAATVLRCCCRYVSDTASFFCCYCTAGMVLLMYQLLSSTR